MSQSSSIKEKIISDKQFPFNFFNSRKNKKTNEFLHYHDCLEINFVVNGSGVNLIDNSSYVMKKGDLFIINNLSHHMAISNKNLEMKIITFNPDLIFINDIKNYDYLKPFYIKDVVYKNKIFLLDEEKEIVEKLFQRIEKEWNSKQIGCQLFIRAQLMELLAIIYRNLKSNEESGAVLKEQLNYEKIRNSVEYLNQNYKEDISLEDLASMSNMSRNYFCTFFKQVMKMTTIEYIDLIRINKATLLLKTTSKSILEIAGESGYNNLSSFNVAFKKIIKESPRNYRKML